MLKKHKIKNFFNFLETTSLDGKDKKTLKFMIEFLQGNHISELADKSFLFSGEQGIGKTYLAEKLIEALDLPVLFLGSHDIKGKEIKKVGSLNKLIKNLDKFEQGIIFIDDIKYVLKFDNELDELTDDEKKRFMKLLEYLKRTNKRVVFIMTLNDMGCIDDSWLDRIEIKIEFNLPSEENKLNFLKQNFKKFAKINELKYISTNSIGYNYRDLPQLIKLAYREGDKKINMESLKKALTLYTPSSLTRWDINHAIKIKLKDIIGNNHAKKEFNKLMIYIKNKRKLDELGIKRANLVIFSGPPGTGKTYTAMAFAGELGLPLVKIKALEIAGRLGGPINGMAFVINIAKRFRNCVVFIDDVDKIVGRSPFALDEEGPTIAQFGTDIDDKLNESQGIVILAVNNITRLGRALQDRFAVINFNNPDSKDRREFIKRLIKKSKIKWNLKTEDLVRMTDKMNYRDMQRLWNECVFNHIQNKSLDYETFKKIVSETKTNINRLSMFG